MAYTPVIIAHTDYGDIRQALGFANSDATSVPDSLVEARPYLPRVEIMTKREITTYATIIDDTDVNYVADRAQSLKDGVMLWVASRLAWFWFAGKARDEVADETIGALKMRYKGTNWTELAVALGKDAAKALELAEWWDTTPSRPTVSLRSGYTRAMVAADDPRDLSEWETVVLPPIVDTESAI